MRHLTRRTMILAAALFVAVLGVTVAVAANVHFKHGSPVFTDKGLYLNASGSLAGLGNGDVVIQLTVQNAQPVASCTNPAGQTQPPGRNPAPVTLTGAQAIPSGDIKNGNLAFSTNTAAPASPVSGAPECPNAQWTERITDVIFSGLTPAATATIDVFQGAGCALSGGVPNAACGTDPVFTSGPITL